MTRNFASFCFVLVSLLAATAHAGKHPATVIGWVEKVRIDLIDSSFPAKLDTGATTSSLGSKIIKLVEPKKCERGNHGTVIFSVTDDQEHVRILERKIQRWVRIKSKDGGFIRRPVVKMTFCIADELIAEEVNMADREHFVYPVLIGRNMMQEGKLAIDASRTFTFKPSCKYPK